MWMVLLRPMGSRAKPGATDSASMVQKLVSCRPAWGHGCTVRDQPGCQTETSLGGGGAHTRVCYTSVLFLGQFLFFSLAAFST